MFLMFQKGKAIAGYVRLICGNLANHGNGRHKEGIGFQWGF
jgi:hypothetical protein